MPGRTEETHAEHVRIASLGPEIWIMKRNANHSAATVADVTRFSSSGVLTNDTLAPSHCSVIITSAVEEIPLSQRLRLMMIVLTG